MACMPALTRRGALLTRTKAVLTDGAALLTRYGPLLTRPRELLKHRHGLLTRTKTVLTDSGALLMRTKAVLTHSGARFTPTTGLLTRPGAALTRKNALRPARRGKSAPGERCSTMGYASRMADPRALVRVLDELLWVLRRAGLDISTAQAIDAVRAAAAVGLERRADFHDAVAAVVVTRRGDSARFDAAFDSFFSPGGPGPMRGTLWDRLSAVGFDQGELDVLRALLASLDPQVADSYPELGILLERGADLDRALAREGPAHLFDAEAQHRLGFLTHGLISRLGFDRARQSLVALRAHLAGALGARGHALADALAGELDTAQADVRAHVRRHHEGSVAERQRQGLRRLDTTHFFALTDGEIEEVRGWVRRRAAKLRGAARLRVRRRVRHGRIDPHRTLRRALGTGGVPMALERKHRRRDRPKLVLLCDVSDSVRAAARFLLEFMYAAQEIFQRTKSFVFVSDLAETTQLFARETVQVAIARAWRGEVVSTGDNSNYGRAFRAFDARFARDLDRRTTVVVLGDGRTNYFDPAADVLARIRDRARALIWLCPEPRSHWGQGDSAMVSYAAKCNAVYEVRCAADLERAARALVSRG